MAELKVRIAQSTRALMERLAKREGVSLNAFAAAAIAEKCAAIESAEAVLRAYANGADSDDALNLLRTMGRPGQLREGDELPREFRPAGRGGRKDSPRRGRLGGKRPGQAKR